MIKNDYLLLECIYPFYNDSISRKDSMQKISAELTTVKHRGPYLRYFLKKSLHENYGIVDKLSLISNLSYYQNNIYKQLKNKILYDLFLEHGKFFLTLTEPFLRETLSEKYLQTAIRAYKLIAHDADDISKINELYFAVKEAYFVNKSVYYDFFLKNEDLLSLCPDVMGLAFDRIRQISIIKNSYELDYICEGEAQELLTKFGIETKYLFRNWEEYFASVLVGKIFQSDFNGMAGRYITKTIRFVVALYVIITSYNTTSLLSKIWDDLNFANLLSVLNKKYSLEEKLNRYGSGDIFFKTKDGDKLIMYPPNYDQLIAGKNSDYLIPLNSKPSLKRIKEYDTDLSGFINWEKICILLFLMGVSLRLLLKQSWILGGVSSVITLVYFAYLCVIGSPTKLYKKGTLIPAIVVDVDPIQLFTIAPMSMYSEDQQRWGIRNITLPKTDVSLRLNQQVVCVASYGSYKKNYYTEYDPHPIIFGFDDPDVTNKAIKKIDDSKIYPENIWAILPDIYEKYQGYALTVTVILNERFEKV